jgi:hypothetical protein
MDKIPLFPLGQVMATPGALAAFEEAGKDPATYLARHNAGNLCRISSGLTSL